MKISWGNGNQEMRGLWRTEVYVGEENVGVGERNYKGTWSFCTPGNKRQHLK